MKIAFLTDSDQLNSTPPGGVQLCSQEYRSVILRLGKVTDYYANPSRHFHDRIRRKYLNTPYLTHNPLRDKIILDEICKSESKIIFINHGALLRYAAPLKRLLPQSSIFHLSHGNQTGDDLFEAANPAGRFYHKPRFAATTLGGHLLLEGKSRMQYLDGVVTMSEEEVVLEQWLGDPDPFYFPRIIRPQPIDRQAIRRRVGFMGTLDHTPNTIALKSLFQELDNIDFCGEIRLIGGPREFGKALAQHYDFVSYLGPLNMEEAQKEIASWELALNPIFWLSRGASMKLKSYLELGIPTLTTQNGARGYKLPKGSCLWSAGTARDFAIAIKSHTENPNQLIHTRSVLESGDTQWLEEDELAAALAEWINRRRL